MTMSVVDIGVMRMAVEQPLVNVSVRMRLTRRRRWIVPMTMMLIMAVAVFVLEQLVHVFMFVTLADV